MISATVAEELKIIPSEPGVYKFKAADGALLYIGKAKNLRSRVSNYFHESRAHSPRIQALVEQIAHIDYIVTQSDVEALILEANLIKSCCPRYNILMQDDKKYPWLMLTDEPFPRLEITRQPDKRRGKTKYFGPYATAGALYQTLQLIKKIFPLRQRKSPLFKDRPCMNYHIGSCMGPCQSLVTAEEYRKVVRQLELFLKGDSDELLTMLKKEMEEASEALNFEKAAKIRDRYHSVQTVLQRQRVMYSDPTIDQDVIGISFRDATAYIALLKVRKGKLIETLFFDMFFDEENMTQEEVYRLFLSQYYERETNSEDLPNELVIQFDVEDAQSLSKWISSNKEKIALSPNGGEGRVRGVFTPSPPMGERAGVSRTFAPSPPLGERVGVRGNKKVSIHTPKRSGPKKDILGMAIKNAMQSGERAKATQKIRLENDPLAALLVLAERLNLPEVPRRIECYDISHIGGTNTVASMVVFTDGATDKKEYRRFRIKSVEEGKPDDFRSMAEVMTRRFSRREDKGWPDPDLIIIDGGKGQLSSAVKALNDSGIVNQSIISLAKRFEEVYIPKQSHPIIIERDSIALYLLQRIRDEAHRFAISYHRELRGKSQMRSLLDDIPGIGKSRKQSLLENFDSIEAICKASPEEIAKIIGIGSKRAAALHDALRRLLEVSSREEKQASKDTPDPKRVFEKRP